MRKKEERKMAWPKKKIAAGIVSLTIAFTATTGIAYADIDLAGLLQSWFNKKTEIVMESLGQSIQSETDKQKILLKEELQLRLQASATELDAYTEEQKRLHTEAIKQYAAALIANMDIDNEQDRQQMLDKLQIITDSAQEAMNALAGSYVQPQLTFIPLETPTVTDAVYGNESSGGDTKNDGRN
ncbi:hypothetical protein [Paenibacillus nasutitermitis]|uniref:Uncharacterized protein n=1 Tax=Paenibacillus nasutitermitis TaxID=1652958 RepID=A0A916ZES4_9BACL|nr:hypothetical protein [Paenibacillus nasutitermitis]GGD91221.1 hypothetical protein GCM10010911_57380 [Paenibacillus nasutitermitis]